MLHNCFLFDGESQKYCYIVLITWIVHIMIHSIIMIIQFMILHRSIFPVFLN